MQVVYLSRCWSPCNSNEERLRRSVFQQFSPHRYKSWNRRHVWKKSDKFECRGGDGESTSWQLSIWSLTRSHPNSPAQIFVTVDVGLTLFRVVRTFCSFPGPYGPICYKRRSGRDWRDNVQITWQMRRLRSPVEKKNKRYADLKALFILLSLPSWSFGLWIH